MSHETTVQETPVATSMSLVAISSYGTKTFAVREGSEVLFGRSYPADFVVVDPSLSRSHARIRVGAFELEVTDVGSTHGTWLDGQRVQCARIRGGEPIRLGNVTLLLQSARSDALDGISGYDRFLSWLEQELSRSRGFRRSCSLLLVQTQVAPAARGSSTAAIAATLRVWQEVGTKLRRVDRKGLYSPSELLIGLPELDASEAEPLAQSLRAIDGVANVGCVTAPRDGLHPEELIAAVVANRNSKARQATRVTSSEATEGAVMAALRRQARTLAASSLPLLLIGETGVGKEVLAREIHAHSTRRSGAFIPLNCAAIPPSLAESILFGHEKGAFTGADKATRGLFELAHEGTLFLDEIGELPAPTQAALLRVLESRSFTRLGGERVLRVDVRVLGATHRDLEQMAHSGKFRQDLLFRLAGASLCIAPLRERLTELDGLVAEFLAEANADNQRTVRRIQPAAWARLRAYAWPGNIRELRNAIYRAVVLAEQDEIDVGCLPERVQSAHESNHALGFDGGAERSSYLPSSSPALASPSSVRPPEEEQESSYKERVRLEMNRYETSLLLAALRDTQGNQSEAAARLKIPLRTLVHKMKELGIKRGY